MLLTSFKIILVLIKGLVLEETKYHCLKTQMLDYCVCLHKFASSLGLENYVLFDPKYLGITYSMMTIYCYIAVKTL